MAFADYASFRVNGRKTNGPVSEAELKEFVSRLRDALVKRSFDAGDIYGSATDMWGFNVETRSCEVLIGSSPPEITHDGKWDVQVMISQLGWFKKTRDKQFADLKRVEWAVHEALSVDLAVWDLDWLLEPGRVQNRARRATP